MNGKYIELGSVFSFMDIRVEIMSEPVLDYDERTMVANVRIAGPMGTSHLRLGLADIIELVNGLDRMAKIWADVGSFEVIDASEFRTYLPARLDGFDSRYAVGAS